MSDELDFDLGPLTWVKAELDNALEAAREALIAWNGEDLNPLKAAAAHLHQVYGALQIVDLRGVSLMTAETERLLDEMTARADLRVRESAEIALRAIAALKAYLDGLMCGAPHTEIQLAGILHEVVARRGGEAPAPSELFHPDTSARAPRATPEPPLDDAARKHAIHAARQRYQRGLLMFLQNKAPDRGLTLMELAVREVENVAPGAPQYTFWWSAAGLMESLKRGSLPADFWVKRLCGRVDLQMRRLMEGSRQLADRLFRDVLYYVARDAAPEGRAAQARALFELRRYLPPAGVAGYSAEQLNQLRLLKDNLAVAKDQWIRYCSGRGDSLEPFQHAALTVFEAAARLPNGAMRTLARIVQAVAKRLPGAADATRNEALQLEMATALLLAQNAAEHYDLLGEQFDRQSDVQAMRLQAAIDPAFDRSQIPEVDLLDDVSRAAQEKLVVAQVTHEIQANLNQIEEILDKFFRNAEERAGLPMVPNLMKQVLGALNILQLDVAADLVRETVRRIEHFSEADARIAPENLDWVAEALSTLGLYIEALRYGRDDTRGMANLLTRPEVRPREEESVEAQIRAETDHLKDSVGQWAADGGDVAGREALEAELAQLARDADLVGDARLRGQTDAALRALREEAAPEAVQHAMAGIGEAPTAVPAPSAEAVRLAASSDETVDRELLDTYIEEANEVLGTIAVKVARLHVSPYDGEAFSVVRRGFHTLKGSGRMVGLTVLAELAWEVEQTLNLWLRDERAPTPEMLTFLEDAGNAFQVWIGELEARGEARVEAGRLEQSARMLRGGEAMAPSPPKPEAGVQAAADVGDRDGAEANQAATMVDIEGHLLPAELFAIFCQEAAQRLDDLAAALHEMACGHRSPAWETFIRAAHTLAGIARTTGFQPLADAAHAVELWAGNWPDKTQPLSESNVHAVRAAVDLLAARVEGIVQRRFPEAMPLLAQSLPVPALATEAEKMPPLEDTSETLSPATVAITPDVSPAPGELIEMPSGLAEESEDLREFHPPEPARAAVPAAVDELDAELLPIFLDEAMELLPRIGETLRAWRATPEDATARDALKRALHTLKGSSRMAGAMVLGEAVHALETRLIDLPEGAVEPGFLEEMEAAYDRFADIIDQFRHGPASASPVETASHPASDGGPLTLDEGELAPAAPAPVTAALPPAAASMLPAKPARQSLRMKSDILDTLLNEAGEVAIARARIENVLSGYKQTAQELAANVDRLRTQLRELEIQAETQMRSRLSQMDESHFDPLEFDRFSRLQELTRLMAESVNDVSTVQENLLSGLNEADGALVHQSRMARTLQQELMRLRMLPLGTLAERLHRVARQAAKETGRKAQLELEGGQTELDRGVLDKIAAPLEHLVRNAVAHGIEPPAGRLAAGKAEYGEIRLSAIQEGNEIVLTLSDDGAGIDYARARARAEALGWLKPDETVSPEQLQAFLFRSGFTTAETVTELAGRGIGLDVVRNEISSLGGRVRMTSEPGGGTRFIIRLPLTLALTQVVLASAGGQIWALPANLVTLVKEVRADQIHLLHEAGELMLDEERYPLRTLAELVGRQPAPGEGRLRTILLLRAGEQRLALRVDHLEGNHEAVVKNIGPQLARVAGISGATVLGDGRVALILNPFQLAERAPHQAVEEEASQVAEAPLILVVDDSLTVRKITSRFLQREGYRVAIARDGVEALELLEEEVPAVMLLDIEMPRMDGFEVARNVRAGRLAPELPIIMITSRTAEKHRNHALELGVNAYLGKPYQEEVLLGEIVRLSGAPVIQD